MSKADDPQVRLCHQVISTMNKEEQTLVHTAANRIRETVNKFGDAGYMALALVSSEVAAQEDVDESHLRN